MAAGRRAVLFITHDVEEAVSLSDRVPVMSRRPGRIKAVHEVPLDCDRTDPVSAREAPGFGEYVGRVPGSSSRSRPAALDMEGLRAADMTVGGAA